MTYTAIRDIQGETYTSSYANQDVKINGVVTGVLRRGFFLQTPDKDWDGKGSDAVFVYSPDWVATKGAEIDVSGKCIDFTKHDTAKPVTQIHLAQAHVRRTAGPKVAPVEFTQHFLNLPNPELALLLNSLEGMLVSIAAGQTFIAPSNRYGDYVLALDWPEQDLSALRTEQGGVIVEPTNHLRWMPGFRVTNYNHAQRLNVGSKLLSDISGPLNYRVDAYQISVSEPFVIDESFVSITKSELQPSAGSVTIMTLNCFNLDPKIESENMVMNPRQDIDDDWGEGRFHTLAQAVVLQANVPDIIALQEIQDNDGAEMTDVVDASDTYDLFIKTIADLSGVRYKWVDVEPTVGADGGQPGGNIRNGYLYNPKRVELNESSVRVFGKSKAHFDGSRKPLICEFKEIASGKKISVINVHLASKRHQHSIFSPLRPGEDDKLDVRVQQAERIRQEIEKLYAQGKEYYLTGDFNDTEHSATLNALTGSNSVNLVLCLPEQERYDYNHRGKLQVLMHGIVSDKIAANARYEVIHGNELIGITPGEDSDKPSDHAYVIAKLPLT